MTGTLLSECGRMDIHRYEGEGAGERRGMWCGVVRKERCVEGVIAVGEIVTH